VMAKISNTGVLVYRSGLGDRRNLIWFDRGGKTGNTVGSPDLYENPRLSPDGGRVAVFRRDPGADIWIFDLERGGSARLTSDPAVDNDPLWSPDGKQVAFVSNRDGGVFNLYVKSAGGTADDEVQLLKTPNNKRLNDWSADGRYILYEEDDPKTRSDLWVLPLFGDRQPRRVLGTRFNEVRGALSPDGRWIAYASDETGGIEVYVQTFPPSGSKWPISFGAGNASSPRWRADGKELFFDSSGRLTAVDLTGTVPGSSFKAGPPRILFRGLMGNSGPHNYDLTPGGDRFLVLTTVNATGEARPLVVETNWTPPLERP